MKFRLLIIVMIFVFYSLIYVDYAESLESGLEKESNFISKIQPILLAWQNSENPNEFAKINNIPLVEDKVKVYIYLENQTMREKIPPEITTTGFDGNIVGALVSSDNLDTLDRLDFVQRITVPVLAQTPPVPQIENQDPLSSDKDESNYVTWVLILGVVIFLSIVIIKKGTTFKTKPNKN